MTYRQWAVFTSREGGIEEIDCIYQTRVHARNYARMIKYMNDSCDFRSRVAAVEVREIKKRRK